MNMRIDQKQSLQFALSKQMLQSVELLHLPVHDLHAFVARELEQNPFLELAESGEPPPAAPAPAPGTDRSLVPSASTSGSTHENYLESPLPASQTLHDSLEQQLGMTVCNANTRRVGVHIIRALNPDGYLGDPVSLLAMQLDTTDAYIEEVLALVQTLSPTGVAARNLAECLSLQLRERNRLDPAMRALLDNLPLMAGGNHAALKRICGVNDEDLNDMFAEIHRLDPRPGRIFDNTPVQVNIPDVFVHRTPEAGWSIQINDAILPRVLLNMTYYHEIRRDLRDADSRRFLSERLRSANWLVQGLDQRVRTILSVTTEIVRQQSAFFERGIEHLRPLKLKDVAEAIGVHESTVSRVTSNKSLATERGLFPMKFFFPVALGSCQGDSNYAADAVRFRIRQIVESEPPAVPFSDSAIALKLAAQNIKIARRTVTKYRESLNIPSVTKRTQSTQPVADLPAAASPGQIGGQAACNRASSPDTPTDGMPAPPCRRVASPSALRRQHGAASGCTPARSTR